MIGDIKTEQSLEGGLVLPNGKTVDADETQEPNK